MLVSVGDGVLYTVLAKFCTNLMTLRNYQSLAGAAVTTALAKLGADPPRVRLKVKLGVPLAISP